MKINRIHLILLTCALGLGACEFIAPVAAKSEQSLPVAQASTPTFTAAATKTLLVQEPTLTSVTNTDATAPTASPEAPNTALKSIGPNPEDIPSGYNPLTGLPAGDPESLKLPAVLISITNFPPSARPQAGLSFSPWVFEIYISEGMTRYLATFYGAFPEALPKTAQASAGSPSATEKSGSSQQGNTASVALPAQTVNAQVGPVRSGRLAYVYIRDFFQDSCLVYASATPELRSKLRGCAMVFGNDTNDINSAMLDVSRLQKIAEQNQRDNLQFNYSGSLFTDNPQNKGLPANQINIYYSYLNQGQWQYNSDAGAFLKFDDFADGSGKFTPAKDRLNDQQLAFSNVIVLFTEHTVLNPYIIDVKMGVGEKGKAVIFRDGQRFDAVWSTMAGEYEKTTGLRRPMRFEDANGNPFALKPGQTWVHIVTPYSEVQDKGAGLWNLRFYAPAGSK